MVNYLDLAHEYALNSGGCKKVAVGSCIVDSDGTLLATGSNVTFPVSCKEAGCRRIQLYGEDSKNHRLPEDCRALHSEIDALTWCSRRGLTVLGATMYVTRYPCEACARAIVNSGIAKVIYGRQQEISEETKLIFAAGGVEVIWKKEWDAEDTTR